MAGFGRYSHFLANQIAKERAWFQIQMRQKINRLTEIHLIITAQTSLFYRATRAQTLFIPIQTSIITAQTHLLLYI
jgi:hypothetical protein